MQEVLIDIKGLNKEFKLARVTVTALKDINLEVFKGEYLSVMGPSGSGKSTLFNMIGVLDKPSSGRITIGGVDLTSLASREMAYFRSKHIGYVFQSFNLLPQYTAVENVAMPLIFNGRPYAEAVAIAKTTLDSVGLGHRVTHRPDELSGGQQQRVAIARALANKPVIILTDEPTGNLDLHTGEEIIKLLKDLTVQYRVTVVTATHDYKMLATSDRIVWIADGGVEKIQKRSEIDIRVGAVR